METATIDNKVKQVISNIRNLPTPPIVFHQIQKVISDPNSSAGQVASVLAEDPAMSVKVLKLTNSAFYGLAREIESVKHAVMIVGMEAIKNLVLSASVLDMFKSSDIDQEFQEAFWRHSLATAFCGRLLARRLNAHGMVDPDTAFSSGLLHDVGKLIISCFLPEENAKFQEARKDDEESPDFEVEERALGFNHAQVGGFLATQWKLPKRLADSISYHHRPQLSEDELPVAYLVHLGDHIARKTFLDPKRGDIIGSLEDGVMEFLQITDDDMMTFVALLREEYVKAETFMQMAGMSS
ncbi:MAG: HDOD domain-containing protein [candidate division Zixibacteria bacterium]|nr:HDOD domain-containing protein [candidate division Zixibacteria bacterium]MDH3938066.1 HDOD domain-containing protein [candidate division Zixibacteria bacterium]MDH4034561.1 HDOD domain-containing protein [candidate division Zixibacteria bacterium]